MIKEVYRSPIDRFAEKDKKYLQKKPAFSPSYSHKREEKTIYS
jgi:hypothetical protein